MSKLNKAIAALGIVAGLGVAALPLSSYAVEGTYTNGPVNGENGSKPSVSAATDVKVAVESAISITLSGADFTTNSNVLDLGYVTPGGAPVSKDLKVSVTTNSIGGFTLNLKATSGTTMVGSTESNKTAIGALTSGDLTTGMSTSAWAYKVVGGGDQNTYLNYTGITVEGADIVKTSTYSDAAVDTTVTFGVAVDATQPADTYTGNVTFTATAN